MRQWKTVPRTLINCGVGTFLFILGIAASSQTVRCQSQLRKEIAGEQIETLGLTLLPSQK